MTRQEANLQLVTILQEIIQNNPDLRFSQILYNFHFVHKLRPVNPQTLEEYSYQWQNEFYLESERLLKRVQEKVDDTKNPKG